jgi:hypothetical protein
VKKILVVALLVAALAGCSGPGGGRATAESSGSARDSGVAQCEKVAATAKNDSGESDGVPTDQEFEQVERAYQDSQYSDLKRAGLAHTEAVKGYYDSPKDVTLTDIIVKKNQLVATCAKHGIVIPVPSFSMPPLLGTDLPPMTTEPTRPVALATVSPGAHFGWAVGRAIRETARHLA